MIKQTEIQALINRLQMAFDGKPWYGDALWDVLERIDLTVLNLRPPNAKNSIARLLQHVVNWRLFVLKKLEADADFDIEINSKEDWPEVWISSKEEWETLKDRLKDTQLKMIDLLSLKEDDFLQKIVLGKPYTYRFLIEGIIEHDIYHLGQMALLAKIVCPEQKEKVHHHG